MAEAPRYALFRCRAGHTAPCDDGKCHTAVFGEECGLVLLLTHNHMTRDIKPKGDRAACDTYCQSGQSGGVQ